MVEMDMVLLSLGRLFRGWRCPITSMRNRDGVVETDGENYGSDVGCVGRMTSAEDACCRAPLTVGRAGQQPRRVAEVSCSQFCIPGVGAITLLPLLCSAQFPFDFCLIPLDFSPIPT